MGPGGGLRDTEEAAGARGEGLEPSITGPEPVVLPITPPPNGWAFRLAECPMAGILLAGGTQGALYRGECGEKMRRPASVGSEPGSEVLGMRGWTRAGIALSGAFGVSVLALP